MATKSPRSPGSQFTSKGVVQGTALTDPKDGQPVAVIQDTNGVHRLAVDAAITLDTVTVNIDDLTPDKDQVSIGDPNTGAHLKIENDGSIDANIHTSAFATVPDSELIVGTEDGTVTGTKHVVKVNPDGSLAVSFSLTSGLERSIFNEITAVASAATVDVVTYTVPVGVTAFLQRISVSGTNIATYNVTINGVKFDRMRTYFGGSLKETEVYADGANTGFKLLTGDQVKVTVTNFRPTIADFEARIQVIED